MLFHDIKASTARALPQIMTELTARGYKIVHLVPRAPMKPSPDLVAEVAPNVATGDKKMLPFYGAISPSAATKEEAAASVTAPATKVAALDVSPADEQAEPKNAAPKPVVKRVVPKAPKPVEPKRMTAAPTYVPVRPAPPVNARPPVVLDGWATTLWTTQPPSRR